MATFKRSPRKCTVSDQKYYIKLQISINLSFHFNFSCINKFQSEQVNSSLMSHHSVKSFIKKTGGGMIEPVTPGLIV